MTKMASVKCARATPLNRKTMKVSQERSLIERPKRKAIPQRIKQAVVARQDFTCKCGCGALVSARPKTDTCFDHRPPLRLRDVLPDGSDYSPAQHDPGYIDAICTREHHTRTHGNGATTAGTDAGLIKKERKREKRANNPKPERKFANRPFGKSRGFPPKGTRKMRGR